MKNYHLQTKWVITEVITFISRNGVDNIVEIVFKQFYDMGY